MSAIALRTPRRRLVRPVLGFCAHLVLAVMLDPPVQVTARASRRR